MTSRPLRALFLPPMAWKPEFDEFAESHAPNPNVVYSTLREAGIESEIIDPNKLPWNPFHGKNSLLDGLDVVRALGVLTTRRKIDVVVCIFEAPATVLLLLRKLAGYRVPILLWDIGITEDWKLRERVLDIVVPRADGIMVLGTNQKRYIEKRWPSVKRVEVILHHIDTDFFRPAPDAPEGYVLSIGKDHGRDFAPLIEAMNGISVPLWIKTERRIVERLGNPSGVTWLFDHRPYDALRKLYADARFVVIPLRETLNASGVSSLLEAYAMGKAMVISNTEAMTDYIVPEETCIAVPPGDAPAIRNAITRLLSDAGLRERLGAGARRFVEQRFANRPFALGLAQSIRNLTGAASGAANISGIS